MSAFTTKLAEASARNRSLLCVGLDPDPRLAPAELVGRDGWVARFVLGIVEATADLVCAFKPNVAFYEALGDEGYRGLRAVLDGLPKDVVRLGDAKRGDVESTAAAYARALFEVWGFDAVTVSPYLGGDSLDPFVRYTDRGVIVICKTSNPGSGDLQDLEVSWQGERMPLYVAVARQVADRNAAGNLGLVVGATYPEQLARVRAVAPGLPILVPGVGAQQGDLEGAVTAGLDRDGGGILVNASRSVLYASSGADWQAAARAAALELRERIDVARQAHVDREGAGAPR